MKEDFTFHPHVMKAQLSYDASKRSEYAVTEVVDRIKGGSTALTGLTYIALCEIAGIDLGNDRFDLRKTSRSDISDWLSREDHLRFVDEALESGQTFTDTNQLYAAAVEIQYDEVFVLVSNIFTLNQITEHDVRRSMVSVGLSDEADSLIAHLFN